MAATVTTTPAPPRDTSCCTGRLLLETCRASLRSGSWTSPSCRSRGGTRGWARSAWTRWRQGWRAAWARRCGERDSVANSLQPPEKVDQFFSRLKKHFGVE
ncbi:hypothetical protein EJB05_41347 [Eragrostis curvula]|uniref:Uncharacterized protein n=1 Tax=Eragrostis curvula TaxID=38414 RepID=A0A5J9T9C3_9POAL|nr:hypothetical protein EJB05_41347 [Eragrostis curvula]